MYTSRSENSIISEEKREQRPAHNPILYYSRQTIILMSFGRKNKKQKPSIPVDVS